MTSKIKKPSSTASIRAVVEKRAGVDLSACYQCKKCYIGCPVAGLVSSPPSEIIRRLQLGAGDELLQTDLIWTCLSCETCYARCPMGVNVPAIIDTLRALAVEKRALKPKGDMPLFNRMFLGTVRTFGRAYDLSMIVAYKLRTGNLKQDTEKIPAMLKKGKLAIVPPSGADRKTVKQVFSGAEQSRKVSK